MIKYIYSFLILVLLTNFSFAQNLLIKNANIHPGNGKPAFKSDLLIINGRISQISPNIILDTVPNFDAKGKNLFPALIATNTIVGLSEIESVRATRDFYEVGYFNSFIRAASAFNTDSKVIPTLAWNGVMFAQITPKGGRISGQSSMVNMFGVNTNEAIEVADIGMHIQWPMNYLPAGKESQKAKDYFINEMQKLTEFLNNSLSYCNSLAGNEKPLDINYEPMCEVFTGKRKLFVHAESAEAMISAINFFEKYSIKPVIVGAYDAQKILTILKEKNIQLIIPRTHRLPENYDDQVYEPYTLPYLLTQNNIDFALTDISFWEQRNLPFQAGQTLAFGLKQEEALKTICLNPAKILGIDSLYGSIEVGKSASFFLCEGNALDMSGNIINNWWLNGREVFINNLQYDLYEKFIKRYGIKE